jgi:hypothetical protein
MQVSVESAQRHAVRKAYRRRGPTTAEEAEMRKIGTMSQLTACVLAAGLAAGCASAPPKAERYIPPPVGATWTYQVTSTGSFGNDAAVPAQMRMAEPVMFEGQKLLKYESPVGATLQTDKVGTVAVLDKAGRLQMRYDPPPTYEWPLEVGRTWTQDITVTQGNGTKMPMKAVWQVEAVEDVTVPAGTFQAWRLVMTDNLGSRMTIWAVPTKLGVFAKRIYERPATHPQGGAGTQVMELTSVPTVK